MLPDLDSARRFCYVSEAEAALLPSPPRPIVLLGLATTLNEIAAASKHSIQIDEAAVPVRPAVQAACELLGPSSLLSPRLAGLLGGERPCFWSETWRRVLRWR